MSQLKQILLLLIIGLFSSFSLLAQSGTVKGKVTDASNNEPIAFASVLIYGTQTGATTDIDKCSSSISSSVIIGENRVRYLQIGPAA